MEFATSVRVRTGVPSIIVIGVAQIEVRSCRKQNMNGIMKSAAKVVAKRTATQFVVLFETSSLAFNTNRKHIHPYH